VSNHTFRSRPCKFSGCFVLLVLALLNASLSPSAAAQATNASFSGTYTMVFGGVNFLAIQYNMFHQEVGFCPNGTGQLPFGYSCDNNSNLGQGILTGTLVADGNGNITSASTFALSPDPFSYQCSSKYNATPDCPYKVPFGVAWNSTTAYVVGDEVDFTENSTVLTFQAVKNNTGISPNTSTCTATIQPPNCTWDQLYVSATGKGVQKGTLPGIYSVQSNGAAVMTTTPSTGTNKSSFAMVVPSAPLAVGQEIPIVGMPTITNEFRGSGALVRVK
jgi:hypothetical protein